MDGAQLQQEGMGIQMGLAGDGTTLDAIRRLRLSVETVVVEEIADGAVPPDDDLDICIELARIGEAISEGLDVLGQDIVILPAPHESADDVVEARAA